ncbi:hypothetical protein DC083_06680 [Ignatzschineria ureiclastica]|uniref:Uncharacterized protein n=1 Tax=Ignatzschineria ureiclastica TaxID=472582 RepID=A0A2U2ADQ7_9GAMM|nr:hypothetical protein DC083_06680 [Ignatzschineria ureiclastica]
MTTIVHRQMRPLYDLNQEDKNGRFLNIKDQLTIGIRESLNCGRGIVMDLQTFPPAGNQLCFRTSIDYLTN